MEMKYSGSLVKRILVVCTTFFIIPLLLFALLLFDKEKELQKQDVDLELSLLGKGMTQLIQEWVALKEANLQFIAHLIQDHPGEPFPDMEEGGIAFVIQNGVYTASSRPVLIGKPAQLRDAKLQIAFLAPGYAPSIVLLKGDLGLAFDADTWLKAIADLEKGTTSFSLALVGKQGAPVLKTSSISPEIEKSRLQERRFELKDGSFSLLIAVDKDSLEHRGSVELLNTLLWLVLLFLFVGGGCTLWLSHRMSRPLRELHKVMNRVEQGEVSARYSADSLGFEINQIGQHFNQTLKALLEQRLAREVLAKELAIGHEIQKSLFPKELPHLQGIQVAAGFLPAREVAGDFYDLFRLPDDRLLIAVADASDKGISACLYSLLLRSFLRSTLQSEKSLAEALRKTNALFCEDTKETGNFATAWIGLYDLKTKVLTYCSAGHPPALLLRAGAPFLLLSRGMGALGLTELALQVETEEIQLHKGDRLVLFTDGLTEAQDSSGRFLGREAAWQLLQKTQNKTPQESLDFLFKEVASFSQGADQADDLTVVFVKID